MVTSGTFTPDASFDILTIIEEAYERAGKELRGGYELRSARRSLDILTKEWSNKGVNLWTVSEQTAAITAGDSSFNLANNFIDVLEMNWREGTGSNQTDRMMTRVSVRQWSNIANKNQTSDPTEYWINRVNPPVVNFWPTAVESGTIVYYVMRHLEDAGDYTNNVDIPPRFLPALCAGLAYYIAFKDHNIPLDRLTMLKAEYNEQWEMATNEDRERASLKLVPSRRRY